MKEKSMSLAGTKDFIPHNRLRDIDRERLVKTHWHFHKKCYSVSQYDSIAKGYRVIGYMDGMTLRDARFTVSESGRQRVLREGVKNVHAHVSGFVEADVALPLGGDGYPLRYNPYRNAKFQRVSENGLVDIDNSPRVTLGRTAEGISRMEATL